MPTTAVSDKKMHWLREVLGVELRPPVGDGMAEWKRVRAQAVADLHAVASAAGKLDFPDAPEAVILLRSIAANLTEEPGTARQRAELRNYLTNDDLIDEAEEPNGFGIAITLRKPLLAALNRLDAI